MRRYWLIFSQAVTVLLAALFVVATLKPAWLKPVRQEPRAGLGLPVAAPPTPPVATPGSLRFAAQRASAAVVSINTSTAAKTLRQHRDPWFRHFFGDGEDQPQLGLGSGVIISAAGYVLTNNHVVEQADDIEVQLNDGRRAPAQRIGTDPDTDLALLRIQLDALPVIALGNSDSLAVGDAVLAIGNPFGVGQTVTGGIVSALGRNQLGINTFENFIQTDAAINPGNSGGALVNAQGELMGINTAIYSRSGGSMGIGFAIPVTTANEVAQALLKDGKVTRGWIGVEPRKLTPELASSLGITSQQGVVIYGVLQGGPAAQAGLRSGDVIVSIAGQPVAQVAQLLAYVAALPPGRSAPFSLLRGDKRLELPITPGTRPPAQRAR